MRKYDTDRELIKLIRQIFIDEENKEFSDEDIIVIIDEAETKLR